MEFSCTGRYRIISGYIKGIHRQRTIEEKLTKFLAAENIQNYRLPKIIVQEVL
jgi:hypothetical protein